MPPKAKGILIGMGVALVLVAAALWTIRSEVKVHRELEQTRQVALDLADLHAKAASGELRLLAPKPLETALLDARFPPRRPTPNLTPRAQLLGGSLKDAGGLMVAVAHYAADTGRLTLFTLPASAKDLLPDDAAPVVRRGVTLQMVRRGKVTIAFWTAGYWVTAVASEMPDADRDLLIDLVRSTQGG